MIYLESPRWRRVGRKCLCGLRGRCEFLENKSGKWLRESAKRIEEVEGLQANCGQTGKSDNGW